MAERQTSKEQGFSGIRRVKTPLELALRRARCSLIWERVWPPLAAILTVLGIFLAASWLGLWLWLPPIGRVIGLALFAVLLGAAAYPLAWFRVPSSAEGLRRLDHRSGLAHRPATAVADDIAATPDDPISMALWREHVARALRAARALKAGWPVPRVALRDPYAVRGLVLVLVFTTFFAAGGERGKRLAAAFDWRGVVTTLNYRVDAWVTPPPYTARPPVILPGLRRGEPARAMASVSVPAGSALVIRATRAVELDIAVTGGIAPDKLQPSAPTGTAEHRYIIQDNGEVTLRGVGDDDVTWSFTAIPDQPPVIALLKEPEAQARGALALQYKIEDDYGVTDAQATFERKEANAVSGKAARPLYGPPDVPLVLPQARARSGAAQTIKDLSEHPWAGVDVSLTLVARDEAGNEGRSEPRDMQLPERSFTKPLARALIEQRRILALDAEAKPRVLTALNALTIAPEKFTPEAGIYLGLRSLFWQLTNAKSDDALRDVVTRLWAMAVFLEDGNVSDAEAALRAAQDALREALNRGASEEELKRLTDQLRAALDKFMQALAEELRKNPQRAARLDPNARNIRPQDLKSMIDRLESLARSGAKDAARRLLDELQQLLENLQTARPGASPGDEGDDDDDMMAMLNELGDMIRKQQQLRDRTFRQGQENRRGERQRGQRGERNQQGNQFGELRQDQQALRDQLRKLLEEMRKRGLGQPGQEGQPGQQGQGEMGQFGRAGEAMGDAEGALGEGNADSAVDAQGRALEALRRGAQGMAQAMQQMGIGPGPGQPGRTGPARAQQETDPLGRPLRGRDYGDDVTVKVPGEIDVQRARRILEELRRRFADPLRPQIELDYIERLLRDF
jgi:uncharacterized protein (TIGR02302 family)